MSGSLTPTSLPPPPLTATATSARFLVLRAFNHAYKSRLISHVLDVVPCTLVQNSGDSLAFALPPNEDADSLSTFLSTSHLFYKYLACCFVTSHPPSSFPSLLSLPSLADPAKSIKIAAVAKPLKDLLIKHLPEEVNLTQGPEHTHEVRAGKEQRRDIGRNINFLHSLFAASLCLLPLSVSVSVSIRLVGLNVLPLPVYLPPPSHPAAPPL